MLGRENFDISNGGLTEPRYGYEILHLRGRIVARHVGGDGVCEGSLRKYK